MPGSSRFGDPFRYVSSAGTLHLSLVSLNGLRFLFKLSVFKAKLPASG